MLAARLGPGPWDRNRQSLIVSLVKWSEVNISTLRKSPLTGCILNLSSGEIVCAGVTKYVVESVFFLDIEGVLADDDGEFDFVVHLVVLGD